jgi:hypothetical protein
MMTVDACGRFHNALRILLNIDASDFPGPVEDWPRFRDQPHRYFIECDDGVAAALWEIIERRQNPPTARVYSRKTGFSVGWWYIFDGDEAAFGPFPSAIDAGRACREECLRRAAEAGQ